MRVIRFHSALIFALFLAACMGTQAPAPVSKYNLGQGAGTTGIHTVSAGETLWSISKRYNIASRDIAVVNRLDAPFYLSAGQRLKLPPPQQYKVRPRDNMNTVSRLFGVAPSEIAKMNNLHQPYKLKVGQVLRLPSITEKTEPEVFATANAIPTTSLDSVIPAPVQVEVLPSPNSPHPVPANLPRIGSGVDKPAQPSPPGRGQGEGQNILQLPRGYGEEPIQMASAKPAPKSPVTAKLPKRSSNKFLQPVKGKLLSSYGPKDNGSFNDGINIAAARDLPVKAAENGVVVYADNELKGSGNLVLIRHADRWMTAYAHLGDIKVKRGAVVKRGDTIGTVGSSGSVDKPQLHFEVRRGTEAINPEVYLEG
jgi:murein DD-endopeptidase MepM/ murein hydrolase activator NlpD